MAKEKVFIPVNFESQIDDNSDTASELSSTELTVSDTSDLKSRSFADNQRVATLGYSSIGDGGANVYVYHKTGQSSKTEDDGFIIFGKNDSYFEALDKTKASPRQFGAHPNKSGSKNLAALQNLFSNAPLIIGDNNSYSVAVGELTMSISGQQLQGNDIEFVVPENWDNSTSLIKVTGSDIRISDITLSETNASPTNSNKNGNGNIGISVAAAGLILDGISVDGFGFGIKAGLSADYLTIDRCDVTNAYSWGVEIDSAQGVAVNNSTSNNNGLDGWKLQNMSTRYVDNCRISGITGNSNGQRDTNASGSESTNGNGIDLYNGGNELVIENSYFEGNYGSGVNIKGSPIDSQKQSEITLIGIRSVGNKATSGGASSGLGINSTGGTASSLIQVIGCQFLENEGRGINLLDGYGVHISNCNISRNDEEGIRTDESVRDLSINNNNLFANKSNVAAIMLGNDNGGGYFNCRYRVRDNIISGNYDPLTSTSDDPKDVASTKETARGIRIYSDVADVVIENNSFYNMANSDGNIWVDGRDIRILGNYFYGAIKVAIAVYNNSGATIEDNTFEECDFSDTSAGAIWTFSGSTANIGTNTFTQSSSTSGAKAIRTRSGTTGLLNPKQNMTNIDRFDDGAGILGTISVKDFGAVGDGSTDDSTVFQEAIDAGNGEIFVPNETYAIVDIKPNSSTNKLVISGEEGATLTGYAGGGDRSGILIDGSSDVEIVLDNVTFDDFELGVNQDSSYEDFVTFRAHNCTFKNIERCVWLSEGVKSAHVTDCRFQDIVKSSLSSVSALTFGDIAENNPASHDKEDMGEYKISGCIFSNIDGGSSGEAHAIWAWGGSLIVHDCEVYDLYGDSLANGQEAIYSKALIMDIRNNYLENAVGGQGAICNKSSAGVISNNQIIGGACGIYSTGDDVEISRNHIVNIQFDNDSSVEYSGVGIMKPGSSNESYNIKIVDNIIEVQGKYGIYNRAWGENIVTNSNEIRLSTASNAGTSYAIYIQHASGVESDFTEINDNLAIINASDSDSAYTGILWLQYPSGINSVDNVDISRNRIHFYTAGTASNMRGIQYQPLTNSETGDNHVIRDNIVTGADEDALINNTDANITGFDISRNSWQRLLTVSELPSASDYEGVILYVSDGAAGSPILAFSDGSNWLRSDTGAAVSAS